MAVVDYLDGVEQRGAFNSGVGSGILFRSASGAWQTGIAYAYGISAVRKDGRGAQTLTFVLQYDIDAEERAGDEPFWDLGRTADNWRGFLNWFRGR
jgi:hypothetical protein